MLTALTAVLLLLIGCRCTQKLTGWAVVLRISVSMKPDFVNNHPFLEKVSLPVEGSSSTFTTYPLSKATEVSLKPFWEWDHIEP